MLSTVWTFHPVLADEADIEPAIQPSLGLRMIYDSNIYDSNMTEVESWIGVITPAILITSSPDSRRFTLRYDGAYGFYSADSADNYADHSLGGAAQFDVGSRSRLDLVAATEKQHQDRGSAQTEGLDPSSPAFPSGPDEFDQHRWSGNLRYGAEGNRGRLRIGVGGMQRDYTNNLERTRFLDYQTVFGSAGMSIYSSQRAAIVFDALFTDIRYETPRPGEPSLDSDDWRFLLGITWQATAKTEGSVRVGLQERRFEDPTRGRSSNPSWEINVRWLPLEHSYFDFATSRMNEETFAEGFFIDTRNYKVAWTHEWAWRWESTISLTRNDADFVGALRNDDFREVSLDLRYPQSRLVTWQVGFARRSRDSSLGDFVFDGNMFTIGVNFAN